MSQFDAQLPLYDLQIRQGDEKQEVWDGLRKKWLVLTPEEYVRQCLLRFLIEEKNVPPGLISVERGLKYNSLQKRYDAVVYDREGQPLIATECKRPTVPIDESTMMQLVTYNSKIGAAYLLLTNGKELHFFGLNEENVFRRMTAIPVFEELIR